MTDFDLTETSERIRRLPGVDTNRIEGAIAEMTTRYRPHHLDVLDKRRHAIDFGCRTLNLDGASINLLRYGPDVMVDAGDFDFFYMLEIPLTGGVTVEFGAHAVSSAPGRALFLSPGETVRSHWRADTTQIMFRIDRTLVERSFARATGSQTQITPVFAPEIDLATPVGRRVVGLLGLITAERMESSLAGRDSLAAGPVIEAILETLVHNLAYQRRVIASAEPSPACPYYVRRLRLMLDDPEALTLSISDIAKTIGISERTLSKGTRRFIGLTPYEYLTRRRMEHARALLHRTELTVSRVAALVGYANSGRFAAAFRAFSGKYPSHR